MSQIDPTALAHARAGLERLGHHDRVGANMVVHLSFG